MTASASGAPVGGPNSRAGVEAADRLFHAHASQGGAEVTARLFGRHWVIQPGVFSPALDESTAIFSRMLPLSSTRRLVEVGCGAGLTAVLAALTTGRQVFATDCSPRAIDNTRQNAARHGVSELVSCHLGDLLSPLPRSGRYDAVYWNSSFIDAPAPQAGSGIAQAIYDPGYLCHQRFFEQAGDLTPDACLYLGFSSLGNMTRLRELAAASSWALVSSRSRPSTREPSIDYVLLTFSMSGEES